MPGASGETSFVLPVAMSSSWTAAVSADARFIMSSRLSSGDHFVTNQPTPGA